MMKPIYFILIVIGIVVAGTVLLFIFSRTSAPTPVPQQGTTDFPVVDQGSTDTQAAAQGASVPLSDGSSLVVNDFKHDPQTIASEGEDPSFILAGGTDPAAAGASYQIIYDAEGGTFYIYLYKEPIGTARAQAEQALLAKLGVGEPDLCRIDPIVLVAPGVNDKYLNKDLRASFCPGAIALPN